MTPARILVVLALCLAPLCSALAQKPIEGAWGYVLGGRYEGSLSGLAVNEDGFYEVEFTPADKDATFDAYLLSVTPGEGRVAQILAVKSFSDRRQAEEFVRGQEKLLEAAHGPSRIEEGAMVVENGGKSVALSLDEDEDAFVAALVYQDDDLTARTVMGQEPTAGGS